MKQTSQSKKQTTKTCNDKNCSIHGTIATRGRTFTGTITSSKAQKTATVKWGRLQYSPKYERYSKLLTKIHAHNPECINANEGDIVTIQECRPISKTKSFIIIEKHDKNIEFLEQQEQREEQEKIKYTKSKQKKKETTEEETQESEQK